MAERIDELQLLIGSDASRAIEQLGALAGALDTAASSTRKLAGATGFLSSFSVSLSRIANTNLDRAIGNLDRLSKLDLSNLKNKSISIDLQVNGADRADRLKYATEQAAKSILKDSDQIAKSLGREYKMDTSSVSEMQEMIKEYIKTVQSGGDSKAAMDELANHIAASSRKSSAEILNTTRDMKAFIDYVNKMQISPDNISSDAKQFWTSMGLERQLKKGAYGIDSWWQESSFQDVARGVIKEFDLFTNPEDQFYALGLAVMDCRERLQSFVQDEETMNKVNASLAASLGDVGERLEEGISKRMAQSKNAIPLDLDVDQSRFESKIQQAITQATDNKTYKAQPIKFDLDVRQLRQNIEQTIAEVDFDKLPGFAENFAKMSESISQMNQVNLKDTGLTQFTNTLRKLIGTDTSKFDVAALNGITAAVKDMAAIGNIDKSLNGFISAISRLANAGEKTGKSADGLKKLIPELKSAVKTFGGLGAIDATIMAFVSSLSKLASAGDKTNKTADGLKNLSAAVMDFLNALSGAPQINENIAATIQGLGNLAAAGSAAGKTMNNVLGGGGGAGGSSFANSAVSSAIGNTTKAFRGLLGVSLKIGGQGASALGAFLGKLNLLPTHANSIDRTALSFVNLLRAVIPFYGIKGLFDWGKDALDAGSSIVELENVIDTSFGSLKKGYEDISGYVYKWAQGTIDAFGVSQIAAERYAGRLMAMFNSSGFDITEGMRDSAAKMSVDLIERAGDIASFYDITVDEAMTKMQSGLAGMTRPLRSLGINMSVANMQSFALSQGITTAWKSMDQASQMALRYQYILNATQYAAGDFQRTSMSLANQLRLLTLNFQVLSATIGQGLVSAIAPVISWLNLLIKRLIQAATVFRTFMWTLFGKPLQATRGAVDDMAGFLDDASGAAGDLSDSAGGASDGLGKAGKAAKELKKQLQVLPFDELNQLAKDTEAASSGGSGGGGGGGAGGIGGLGDFGLGSIFDYDMSGNDAVDGINKWAKRIKKAFVQQDWQGVGKNIAYLLNHGFGSVYDILDWKKVGPKVYGFIQPFQAAFNSMMYYIDWGTVGRVFGRGLNTITYTLRAWINGFNWRQWGGLIADGMDSMLDEWDADAFGRLIADKFRAAWNFFGGWVKRFNFKQLGTKLKEMVNGAITELNWSDMGETLAGFFNGVSDAIIAFFEDGTVVDNVSESFSKFVNAFFKKFDSEKANEALRTVKTALTKALGDMIRKIDKDEVKKAFTDLLNGLPWSEIGLAIGAVAGAKLAAGIFGFAFKAAALKAIMGVGSGVTVGGGAATVGGGAAGAGAGLTAGIGSSLSSVAGSLGLLVGALKLGEGASNIWARSKGVTETATDKVKSRKMFDDTQDMDVVQSKTVTPIDTGVKPQTTVNTTLTATVDPSFKQALVDKRELIRDPKVTKTVDGKKTKEYTATQKNFMAWVSSRVDKTANGKFTNAYNTVRSNFFGWTDQTSTKTANAQKTNAYGSIFGDWTRWKSETIKKSANAGQTNGYRTVFDEWKAWKDSTVVKTANGNRTQAFRDTMDDYNSLKDKDIDITVKIKADVQRIVASMSDGDVELARIKYFGNATGGLFDKPAAYQIFGEAGAEAAIPLERKSTMKRIADAIVNSGGGVSNNSDEIADAIARRILPALAGMVSDANNRPVNVNATLYTENNEVLARAVTRGQRSIDKRYNPVSQFSY